MAKYDNTTQWNEYSKLHLNKFIDEFRQKLNPSKASIRKLKSVLERSNFKEACAWIEINQTDPEPLYKLRSRFRTYAYKKRNHLTNVTISTDVKEKLDRVMSKLGYVDYSDVIDNLLRTNRDYEISDALGLYDDAKKILIKDE
jgi:hypothetical protein